MSKSGVDTDEVSMIVAPPSSSSSFHFDLDLDPEQNEEEKPHRHLTSPFAHDSCSANEQMRKLIECPVCLEIPLPPIFCCERGHIVCTDCQLLTPNCPLCRGYYSKTRSFVAEGIVENCMLKCKNSEQGCPKIMKGSQLVQHLKICDYRPINCVDCNNPQQSLIPFQEYRNHLINTHKINGVQENNGFVLYNMDLTRQFQPGIRYVWPPYYFEDEDQNTFLIRMQISSSFVCAWVSYVGAKEDCSKFLITIEFHVPRACLERNENRRRFSLVWRGEANHFREDSYKDIFQRGMCLTIPNETVKELGKVSDLLAEWLYHIQIINVHKQKQKEREPVESSPPISLPNRTNTSISSPAESQSHSNSNSNSNPSRKFSSRSKSQNPKHKEKEPPNFPSQLEEGDTSQSQSSSTNCLQVEEDTSNPATCSAGDFIHKS